MYYRGAHAALLLYDITNLSSFDDIRGWLEGEIHIVTMHAVLLIDAFRAEKKLLV